MPAQPTLLQELTAAARGCIALFMGDRRAAGYFDFSQRGLAGSFIAFLIATTINATAPQLFGVHEAPGTITKALLLVAILFSSQVAASAIMLRQIGRLDGLVPYLVADNWATFFITFLTLILTVLGIADSYAIIFVGILVLVVEINIARLIVTLSALQIAMFIVAQLVGVAVALLLIGLIFPPMMPDVAAAAGAA